MLLNQYSLDSSGLAPTPNPCKYCSVACLFLLDFVVLLTPVFAFVVIYQYRRYRTLKGDLSMVRERRDFYQLKKAVGEDPGPEVEVVAGTGVPGAEVGAAAEPVPKRKKKKAQKGRSTAGVEAEAEAEVDAGPETEVVSEGPVGSSKKRTAREEVIFGHLYFLVFFSVCTGTNHCCSSLNR